MSRKKERFPRRRPVDQPPPLRGPLINGRRSPPTYVLAWVCPPRKLFENLGGGKLGVVDDRNLSDVVFEKWGRPEFSFGLVPIPVLAVDGNYYLVAMFNRPDCDHLNRVLDVAGDPLIQSARVSMGVDQDPSLEETLQWFQFPLNWLGEEEHHREMERLTKLEHDFTRSAEPDTL
ncbi:hypothetical protein FB451DRAFT_1385149 [Mycena latifolia]|nr:hypothetical protein FB451DRAFT_1385149 [Mycena latifolia]